MFNEVPLELVEVARRHGQVVAAGDNEKILADFRADRVGQLLASASLPDDLVDSELLDLKAENDGLFAAFIRYTAADGTQIVLRSRWILLPEGWRVTQVRNLPETPPRPASTGPADGGRDAGHWEGLRQEEVRIPRCDRCGKWVWPPRPICSGCHGFAFTWTPVTPEGTVYSWTRTWQPFSPELSGYVPFVTVLCELPEAGRCRLLGVLLEADGVTPRIGQGVQGEIEPGPGDGWPVLRWRLTSEVCA